MSNPIPPPPAGFTVDAPTQQPSLPPPPAGFDLDQQPDPSGVVPIPEPRRFPREGEPITSPLEVPSTEFTTEQDIQQTGTLVFPEQIPDVVRRAADAGVDFTNPASNRAITLSGFALDEKEKERAIAIGQQSKFGTTVPVRRGPVTKAIEFQDPATGRFSLAMPPGEQASALSAVGPGKVLLTELGGGVLGAFGSNPITTTLGAAGGAYLGELMRLQTGFNAGINQEMTDEQMQKSALIEAGIAVGGAVAGATIAKVGKFAVDLVRGRTFTAKTLGDADLNISLEEANELQRLVNSRIEGERLKFTLAQATNDEDLLAMEQFFKRGREFAKDFRQVTEAQTSAIREFEKIIGQPFRSRLSPEETLQAVVGRTQSGLDRHLRMSEIPLENAEKNLDNAITSIRTRPMESLGPTLRDVGDTEFDAFTTWAREGATNLHRMSGESEFIPNRFTVAAVNKLDEQVTRSLFRRPVAAQKALIGQREAGTEGVPEGVRVLRETITGEPQPQTEPILNKIFDPDAKFTFLEAWEGLSALKRVVRDQGKGTSTEVPDVGAVKLLIRALERDMAEGTRGTALREEYQRFINQYRIEKSRLDEGTVAKIMRRSGNRFVVNDESVFRNVFKRGGTTEAQDIHNLIRNDPQALQGMRETISDFYRNSVVSEGRVNLRAHNQFMEDFKGPMGVFFNKQEMQALRQPAQFEKVLQARQAKLDRTVQQLNDSFDTKIANLNNPSQLRTLVLDGDNVSQARRVREILKGSPEVLRAVQADVRKDVATRITGEFIPGTNERVLSAVKLKDMLFGKSGQKGIGGNLSVMFGDQYVKDLVTLQRSLSLIGREARAPNRSNTAFWEDTIKNLARAYVGLFTRPGRIITAMSRIRGRAANRVLFRAMTNPDELRDLMALQGVDLRSKKAARFIGAVGGGALLQDFE